MCVQKNVVNILAIETSCDETAVALLSGDRIKGNMVLSQDIHKLYGGVVPELASRAHEQHINTLVDKLFEQSEINELALHAVAFTQGPGLLGALMVGCAWAKAFAWARGLHLIGVDHLQAHVLSHFIEPPTPAFPFLALLASGGHTQLLYVHDPLHMELLGETLDDAVGEAFDKAAKMLGLPYPGGPALDKAARKGNPHAFSFPKVNVPALNYSFSGLKAAFMRTVTKEQAQSADFIQTSLADLCASIEHTLVNALMDKLVQAQQQTGLQRVCVAGGSAANTALRRALHTQAKKNDWELFIPNVSYCTDNAAMIACTARYLYAALRFSNMKSIPYDRRTWPIHPLHYAPGK